MLFSLVNFNCFYLYLVKFNRASFLSNHIFYVIEVSSKKQVFNITTRRVVTTV